MADAVAILIFTRRGHDLAARLAPGLKARVFAPEALRSALEDSESRSGRTLQPPVRFFPALDAFMANSFHAFACHIFIGACGIAVRAVAPHLKGKTEDPAVLVLDQRGQNVISLLSGHVGGANFLARHVAAMLDARPVITTATDVEDLPALDVIARERGLVPANPGAVKAVSAALLAGEPVLLHDPVDMLGLQSGPHAPLFRPGLSLFFTPAQSEPGRVPGRAASGEDARPLRDEDAHRRTFGKARGAAGLARLSEAWTRCLADGDVPDPFAHAGIVVTLRSLPLDTEAAARCLVLHPPFLCAGVGCRRGTGAATLVAALRAALEESGLAEAALCCLASIDAKVDEPGLIAAAKELALPLRFYSAARLSALPVTVPSPKARERFGVDGVCEPAALAAAEDFARRAPPSVSGVHADASPASLLLGKRRFSGVTVALAAPGGFTASEAAP